MFIHLQIRPRPIHKRVPPPPTYSGTFHCHQNNHPCSSVFPPVSEALEPRLAHSCGAYPGFCSMKQLEVFLLPLDGMLVHRRSLPRNFARFPQQFAGTHLYNWVERGTVRVKCLAQEHNTTSPARAQTQTARSGVEHTNHEATAPPVNKIINLANKWDWIVPSLTWAAIHCYVLLIMLSKKHHCIGRILTVKCTVYLHCS